MSLPCGSRIFTLFTYLTDVDEGGETEFPELGLKVTPKKGRAVLWPSVLDMDPTKEDHRTVHIAQPPVSGMKYSINSWIHSRDFKAAHAISCAG